MSMEGPSRASAADSTPDTESQDQSVTMGIDASIDGATDNYIFICDEVSVPSPEGKNQVGDGKEQLADRQVIPRSQNRLPKVTNLEDVVYQGQRAITKPKWRVTDRPGDRALKGKIKLAMKWRSWRVAEQFCEAVPYRPATQNAKRLKAKARRR
ncbi:hypothetical protein H5410_001458 [Solanum commersonii]|uniref:Uncharacterized protein n=1 Tax=Solanum commersonii TaxID=4109 RepID=A0A9J6AYT8_SOLCO|nr:hypothetical protein H5410_001458 [Solanum commersonii]